MSAIAGFWCLDGRPASRVDLDGMLQVLSHRGPDGRGECCCDSVALGHRLLHTTPESIHECMPLAGSGGAVMLTADARIDNRLELMSALGEHSSQRQPATDSELIVRAYEKWGVRSVEHLVGDFAFALWDKHQQHFFCARDHFGVKPFYYYHRAGRFFAFASEIKGLLSVRDVPRELNEIRVADFLQSCFDDEQITFYQGILRLPPAHTLLITATGAQLMRYWSLDARRELHCASDEEYAERFREIFFEAVRTRLRSAFPVGSTLSGGLDSSSIVCTARDLLRARSAAPLHTFSLVFDDLPQCDERPFIRAVIEGGDLVPHLIRGDRLSPLQDRADYFRHEDEASWVVNMCLHWAMHRAASEDGVRVFLDGLGGDDVVGHGIYRLTELMRSGRLLELVVSAIRLGRNFERSPVRILKRHAIRPLVPPAVLRTWAGVRGNSTPESANIRPLLAPEFAARIALRERLLRQRQRTPQVPASVRGSHYMGLIAGITSAGFESIDRVAAAVSLEPRYPFMDKRLVEFCLALPADQKFRRGWTRLVLRHAMAGTLPDVVCWRGGKADLSAQFHQSFLKYERQRIEGIVFDDYHVIAPYVNIAVLRDLYRDYVSGAKPQNADLIWHPVTLALWLQRAGFARPEPGNLAAAVA